MWAQPSASSVPFQGADSPFLKSSGLKIRLIAEQNTCTLLIQDKTVNMIIDENMSVDPSVIKTHLHHLLFIAFGAH